MWILLHNKQSKTVGKKQHRKPKTKFIHNEGSQNSKLIQERVNQMQNKNMRYRVKYTIAKHYKKQSTEMTMLCSNDSVSMAGVSVSTAGTSKESPNYWNSKPKGF